MIWYDKIILTVFPLLTKTTAIIGIALEPNETICDVVTFLIRAINVSYVALVSDVCSDVCRDVCSDVCRDVENGFMYG